MRSHFFPCGWLGTARTSAQPAPNQAVPMASRLIHFVVALPAEAKPIVSHFRLKPIDLESPFKLYASENRFLIVSSTGERRSAEAVRFLHSFTSRPSAVVYGGRGE